MDETVVFSVDGSVVGSGAEGSDTGGVSTSDDVVLTDDFALTVGDVVSDSSVSRTSIVVAVRIAGTCHQAPDLSTGHKEEENDHRP